MTAKRKSKILPLFDGDRRCRTLLDSLAEVLYERAEGIPLPSVLGVIELLKLDVIENARSD